MLAVVVAFCLFVQWQQEVKMRAMIQQILLIWVYLIEVFY